MSDAPHDDPIAGATPADLTDTLPPRGLVFRQLGVTLAGLLLGLLVADRLAGTLDEERDLRRSRSLLVDERLGWVNRPNHVFPNGRTHVNSLGLRGAEIPADAPPTELRVLAVGASRTFGDLTDEDDRIWSAILERRLRAEGHELRVLNGAVNGYSALQSARRAITLTPVVEPDLILLFIAPGAQVLLDGSTASAFVRLDDGVVAPADVVHAWPRPLAPLAVAAHRALLKSHLYARHRARVVAEQARPPELERFILTDRERPAAAEERLARTWEELGSLARFAQERGVELRVVLVPEGNQANDPSWREWVLASARRGGPPFDTKRDEPTRALTRELTDLGLQVWDLSAEAERIGADVERFTVDGSHWTPDGHRVIAFGVQQRLLAEPGLLDALAERRRAAPRD